MTFISPTRPNAYTGSPLDRASHLRTDTGWIDRSLADEGSLFALVWRGRSLMTGLSDGSPAAVFLEGASIGDLRDGRAWAFLGLLEGRAMFAIDLGDVEDPVPLLPPTEGAFTDLRAAAGALPSHDASVLAHARGLMHWRARHRYCGVCGAVCEPLSAGNVMGCTGCGTHHFPRTDPAVIMLITTGERALLGHSKRFPNTTMYSTLAGFVEPGESLEEAVRREVFEEAGVRVGRVDYHSSQPWPFPASIMLGFYGEALTEDLVVDTTELMDARWFTRDAMRDPDANGFSLPRGDSIARRLIEDWIAAA